MKSVHALILGWRDLFRPRIFRVIIFGIGLTVALFVGLQAATFWALKTFAPQHIALPWVGELPVAALLSYGSLLLFPVMSIFLMIPVAAGFSGLFADQVADAVEDVHYPNDKGLPIGFWDGLLESVAVMAAIVAVTLIALLLTPILGPIATLVFYGANGWLLGREFFQMAARRHLHAPQATALRRSKQLPVTALGVMIAALLTIPIVNIVIPTLAAASFVHLYHLTSPGRV